MNIAIIEKGHFEVCHTLLQLLGAGDNSITVFIDADAQRQLDLMGSSNNAAVNWVIQQPDEPNRAFIRRSFQQIESGDFDLLYLATVSDNFLFYARNIRRLRHSIVVLTLHDINNFFCPPARYDPRSLLRWFGKRTLEKQVHAYTVLSETLRTAAEKNSGGKPVHVVSGSLFDEVNYIPVSYHRDEPIRIVVPGSVDERRRNYEIVFGFLKCAEEQHLPVEVTLLGSFAAQFSDHTQSMVRWYLQRSTNLHVYEGHVDQPLFDAEIRKAHFIWTPVQPVTVIHDGIAEQYGVTTVSGNMADIIRHARPYFAPHFLKTEEALRSSGIFYQKIDDLLHFLRQLTPEKYQQWLGQAHRASMNYSRERVLTANPWLFN